MKDHESSETHRKAVSDLLKRAPNDLSQPGRFRRHVFGDQGELTDEEYLARKRQLIESIESEMTEAGIEFHRAPMIMDSSSTMRRPPPHLLERMSPTFHLDGPNHDPMLDALEPPPHDAFKTDESDRRSPREKMEFNANLPLYAPNEVRLYQPGVTERVTEEARWAMRQAIEAQVREYKDLRYRFIYRHKGKRPKRGNPYRRN